jgi:membrane protein YqaA with SNARE-associated domain
VAVFKFYEKTMRIFTFLYNKMMDWARHQYAPYYLYVLSFAESSFFPVPPDVMLMPMALAKPDRAWIYAAYTTIASVLGGVFGYFIGALAFKLIHPYIIQLGYEGSYEQIQRWFNVWGFWLMFFAGFAPIPYKLFTIAAGAMHIALLPFILGSAVGRGGRFFLVTGVMLWGGERMEQLVARYIERIGWIVVILLLFVYWFWYHQPSHL